MLGDLGWGDGGGLWISGRVVGFCWWEKGVGSEGGMVIWQICLVWT